MRKTKRYAKGSPRRWEWLIRMINHNGYTIGAEIGVANGRTSHQLLRHCPQLHLICVDHWQTVKNDNEVEGSPGCLSWDPQHGWARFSRGIRGYEDRVTVLKGKSVDMAKQVEDASLDFVFIDADHRYSAVYADIQAWAPKVKSEGVLCGHDINYPKFEGVTRAVSELIPAFKDSCIDHVWYANREDYVG